MLVGDKIKIHSTGHFSLYLTKVYSEPIKERYITNVKEMTELPREKVDKRDIIITIWNDDDSMVISDEETANKYFVIKYQEQRKITGYKRITKRAGARLLSLIQAEINAINARLRGSAFVFTIERDNGYVEMKSKQYNNEDDCIQDGKTAIEEIERMNTLVHRCPFCEGKMVLGYSKTYTTLSCTGCPTILTTFDSAIVARHFICRLVEIEERL